MAAMTVNATPAEGAGGEPLVSSPSSFPAETVGSYRTVLLNPGRRNVNRFVVPRTPSLGKPVAMSFHNPSTLTYRRTQTESF